MNNKIAIGLLLALVVAASGCASQTDGELDKPENLNGEVEKKIDVDGAGTIRKVDVDGTTCYLYDWGNAGGLSCIPQR